jgi:hypothetical protein
MPSKTKAGQAGWLHRTGNTVGTFVKSAKHDEPMRAIDAPAMLRGWMQQTTTATLAELADSLGVSRESLSAIGAVWAREHNAWAFPMRTATRIPVGVRLRTMAGKKFAVKGSTDGIFIPDQMTGDGPLMICEGPTDTAAIVNLGFDAIGRPSCNAGTKHILEYLRLNKRDVVIAANYDEPKPRPDGSFFYPGQDGAEALAQQIFRATKIIYPLREKDFRAWINSGANRATVLSVIANTRYFRRKQAG